MSRRVDLELATRITKLIFSARVTSIVQIEYIKMCMIRLP